MVSDVLRRPATWAPIVVAGALAAFMSSCGGADQLAGAPVSPSSTSASTPPAVSSSSSAPDPTTSAPPSSPGTSKPPAAKGNANPPPGRVVVLDPGHNGGNGSH